MAGFKEGSLAGPGYVILNVIRVLNIIVFLDIIAASVVMLVKISLLNSFFFFEAVTHVATTFTSIFLIISELPVLNGYFDRNWPLLGQEHGFATLSLIMIVLGVSVLGDLNNESRSEKAIGMPFWRIILSAGILAMIMGVINIISSFVFRNTEEGVTARHVRAYGAVAPHKVERKTSQKSFQLSLNRQDSLPSYSPSAYSRPFSMRNGTRFGLKISAPINNQPEAQSKASSEPDLAVPNLAHHPAMFSEVV